MKNYEISSDDDIILCVACDSQANLWNAMGEKDLVPQLYLNFRDALGHAESLRNYFDKEDDWIPTETMLMRNFS